MYPPTENTTIPVLSSAVVLPFRYSFNCVLPDTPDVAPITDSQSTLVSAVHDIPLSISIVKYASFDVFIVTERSKSPYSGCVAEKYAAEGCWRVTV